jgi:hypothetical protein
MLPKERDTRLVTIRRGGSLTDAHHRLLAEWALLCAEHVLPLFEDQQPGDTRPHEAIELGRGWIRGEVRMSDSRQAAAVPHVAAHDLGAAAYALRAAVASVPPDDAGTARAAERAWQQERLPEAVRELVLDDERRRSPICWHVFDD